MAAPKTSPVTFNGVSPPWSLANLDANFSNLDAAISNVNNYSNYLVDTGAANAYIVTFPASQTATLTAGLIIQFKASAANTGASTINPSGLGATAITKNGATALAAGDIPAGAVVTVIFDGTQFQLQGIPVLSAVKQIQSISASVAGNDLTISASALSLDFRSATLTSGTVTTVSGTPANLVISSGSTLGTVNAVQSRIAVLALNNAGTIELAAVNIAGGNDLTETGVISTTAEGGAGAADSATVIYSTTARTNVAYRVIGYVESTQATAGTWATAPSTIQGEGGQALSAMSSFGYGQTWQSVTRNSGTTYYNTTGKTIQVIITQNSGGATTFTVVVNGFTLPTQPGSPAGVNGGPNFAVPPSQSYSYTNSIGNCPCVELR